jgi:hypothetical protein
MTRRFPAPVWGDIDPWAWCRLYERG